MSSSSVTQLLPVEQRRIRLRRHAYPISLSGLSRSAASGLKSDISTAARHPGSRPGSAKGGSSRNLAIHLSGLRLTATELSAYLSEARSESR